MSRRLGILLALLSLALSPPGLLLAQQDCDQSFQYAVPPGAYRFDGVSAIHLDEAHYNFHTLEGRYCGFARVLAAHGLNVEASRTRFTARALEGISVLVIANAADVETAALHEGDAPWVLPNRSAFTTQEIEVLRGWVAAGGRLLLIVDHMPFPGSADELAKAFGFTFFNGYAEIDDRARWPSQFRKSDDTLTDHPFLTQGLDSVATFTGSAFRPPTDAVPILVFGDDHQIILPAESGRPFAEDAPRFSAKGLSQGAILTVGRGKVAVFGEAAMFTAQNIDDRRKMGLNAEAAPHNVLFLVNIMRWLLG